MTQFKLVPYTISVRKKRDKELLNLDNLDGIDLFDVLLKAMSDLGNTEIDSDMSKTVSVEKFDDRTDREIFGILRSGDYGIGAHFFNIKKFTLTPDARTTDDSEILPFFFHLYLPKGKKKGLMILQTFRHFAVKGIFSSRLRDRKELSNHMLEFKRVISGKALEMLMKGDLVKISFVRHSIPKDIGSQIGKDGKTDIEEERIFKIKGKFELSERLKDALSNKETKYYEVSKDKYDSAKATVRIGESEVVLTFGEGDEFREFYPLDECKKLIDGFPTFDCMKKESSKYLKDLIQLIEG